MVNVRGRHVLDLKEEYRRQAEKAERAAKDAVTEELRRRWLQIAQDWRHLAEKFAEPPSQ